ncbi:hypothetical protein BDQ17DRAFT_1233800 [Cyathus striatus]|nr:hypothetical protein BDQ17DRAFT_1233800 [Cyathus striatus]
MGRWTQYDEDEHRLPEGFERIGYDADEGKYYFRDSRDGSIWRGAEGVEFGEMTKVSEAPSHISSQSQHRSEDLEAAPAQRSGGYQLLSNDPNQTVIPTKSINTSAYRTLFPFFLIIAVSLLLVWRLILSPGLAPPPKRCPGQDLKSHLVQPGENCWSIAKKNNVEWERFKEINKGIQCEPLMPGTTLCLPVTFPSAKRRTY